MLALEVERALGHGIRLERRRGAARARVRRHPDWRRATARGANILIGQARLSQRARAGRSCTSTFAPARSLSTFARARGDRERAARPPASFSLADTPPRLVPSLPARSIRAPATSSPADVSMATSATVPGTAALSRARAIRPRFARAPAPPRSPRSNSVPRRSPVRSLVASARARDEDPPPFLDDDDLTTYADLDATESRLVAAAAAPPSSTPPARSPRA